MACKVGTYTDATTPGRYLVPANILVQPMTSYSLSAQTFKRSIGELQPTKHQRSKQPGQPHQVGVKSTHRNWKGKVVLAYAQEWPPFRPLCGPVESWHPASPARPVTSPTWPSPAQASPFFVSRAAGKSSRLFCLAPMCSVLTPRALQVISRRYATMPARPCAVHVTNYAYPQAMLRPYLAQRGNLDDTL